MKTTIETTTPLGVGQFDMGSHADADVKFLRRILFALVGLTILTGVLAGIATVEAMNQSFDLGIQLPMDSHK